MVRGSEVTLRKFLQDLSDDVAPSPGQREKTHLNAKQCVSILL